MHSPLLNCFIFLCKLMTSISVLLALRTHHWIRSYDGKVYQGPLKYCHDYGHSCYQMRNVEKAAWFFYIIALLNIILELMNILLLCKRTQSRINLILEELGILLTVILVLSGGLICAAVFILIRHDVGERSDWSFYIFLLAMLLALIELICSLYRVCSYCRNNSFRSNMITYTSNGNHPAVHIQS